MSYLIYQTTIDQTENETFFVIKFSSSLHHPALTVCRPIILTVTHSQSPKADSEPGKPLRWLNPRWSRAHGKWCSLKARNINYIFFSKNKGTKWHTVEKGYVPRLWLLALLNFWTRFLYFQNRTQKFQFHLSFPSIHASRYKWCRIFGFLHKQSSNSGFTIQHHQEIILVQFICVLPEWSEPWQNQL